MTTRLTTTAYLARAISACLVVGGALVAAMALAAWVGPTAQPPSGNTATLLRVEGNQVKSGDLQVNALLANQYCFGSSCIDDWSKVAAYACDFGPPQTQSVGSHTASTNGFFLFGGQDSLYITGTVSNTGGASINQIERFGSGKGEGSMIAPVPKGATWTATVNNGSDEGVWWFPFTCGSETL